jgi:PAS domain S-box-containing protein
MVLSGTLSRIVAIDRVEAFEELTEAEARYRQLFTSAFEGILRVSPDGRILHANPAIAAMVGYGSAEELVEQVSDIGTQLYMHPPDRDKVRSILESEEKIQDYEVTLRRRDGRPVTVALSGYALRDDDGEGGI